MSRKLILKPEAEADLAEAMVWYAERRPGLDDEFLLCVEEAFARLQRTPEMYATVFEDLRIALVRRFPYLVVYRIDDDQVTVVSVYHTSRDPRNWQDRI